jgi:PilZ domain
MHNRFEMRRSAGIPIEVIAPDWDDPLEFISGDLSPRGTYLHTDLMPQIGEHVVCSFNLKTGVPEYCFFGEVTRVNLHRRKCDSGRPGFGVRFLDAKPFERIQIRQALRGLPPPIPTSKREQPIELTSAMLISP